jgi:hypothetical protein
MNISKIIRKILLEDDEKKGALGLNPEDQYTFLNGVINNCPRLSMFKGRTIKNISKDDLNAFPEIKNKGITVAYYATGIIRDSYYMIFGIKDDEASNRLKTNALLMYKITIDGTPERVVDGVGSQCEQLMNISDLGKVNLSAKNQAQLSAYTEYKGAAYVELEKPEDIELYDEKAYKDLTYDDGRPVFNPIPTEPGYIWVRKGIKQKVRNLPQAVEDTLSLQGFTGDETKFDVMSDSAKYKIFLSELIKDWPGFTSQPDALRPTDFAYPTAAILNPDKQTCRTAIKKLDYCIESKNGKDCGVNLFKNKITVLRCGDFNMVGGVLGVKDEYEKVMAAGRPYGLSDLKRYFEKQNRGGERQFESLDKKINSILNEQRRKFKF